MPLKIVAKVDRVDRVYFQEVIRPLLDDPLVEYLGEMGEHDKNIFLGQAYALLFPIAWPEAFGLVMIEAMACGTPVIAYRRGSVPEILTDGVTGWIVAGYEEAVQAVPRVAAPPAAPAAARSLRTVCRHPDGTGLCTPLPTVGGAGRACGQPLCESCACKLPHDT